MRLVPNAGAILRRAHSMWANYLGVLCLLAPELIFMTTGRDTNPRVWWVLGLALIVYGIIGRVRDQGIDNPSDPNDETHEYQSKIRSSGAVTVAAFLLVAFPLVAKWEGKENHAYKDIVGKPTICYGETRGVKMGDYKTDAECKAMLEAGLVEYREGLHGYFNDETKLHRLTAERDAAYVSLAYNVGVSGAGKSTATRRLNAGDIAGGCEALTWWNRAGQRIVRGLVRRRADEYRLCLIGT